MLQCPHCQAFSIRPSHRKGTWEAVYCCLFFLRPYRCTACHQRFVARQDGRTGVPRRALRILCLVGLTALGGVLLTFENRTSLSLLPRATVADDQLDERSGTRAAHRTALQADEARRKKDIAQRAKSEVIRSIALHRSGEEGKDVVAKATRSDDPVFQLVFEVFKNAGVPKQLIEESFKDWTKGVNVKEIGRQWQEKGIDIPTVVKQAESQGLPVRKLMQEKDTVQWRVTEEEVYMYALSSELRTMCLYALLTVVLLGFAVIIARTPPHLAVLVAFGIAVLVLSFVSTEIALYMLVFSMLLSPQIGLGGGGGPGGQEATRAVALRVDDLLLVVTSFGWLARNAIFKELGLVRKTELNRPILVYMVVCAVSTGFGVMAEGVRPLAGFFFVLKFFEYYVVYFMAVNHIRQSKQVKAFLVAMLVVCAIVSLIGIAQIPSGDRVSAPFEGEEGEPNTFGGYLVLMLSVVLGLLLTTPSWRQRWGLFALIPLIMLPLLATLSRSSWSALIPMYCTFLILHKRRVPLVIVLVLAVVVGPLLLPANVKKRFMYTFTEEKGLSKKIAGGVALDASSSARLDSWKQALQGWTQRPLLGFGVTGFGFLDAQYFRVLVETGVVGMAAFLWLMITLFREALRAHRQAQDPLFKGLGMGFVAGFAAMLTHGISSNTFVIVRIMEPFWFLAALVIIFPTLEASAHAELQESATTAVVTSGSAPNA